MTKKNRSFQTSRQRQLRALENARLGSGTLPSQAEIFTPPSQPLERHPEETDSVWNPRILRNGDLPEMTSDTLRAAVNYMAAGIKKMPQEVEDDLFQNHTTREIGAALREGIRRWNGRGKERG